VAASIVKAGLKIRFYDLSPETFAPVVSSVTQNCSQKTLAIISQHLLGVPTDVGVIGHIAKEAGAYHIEDAAQALGGSLKSGRLGASGDFGLFSFGRGKPMPLGGGGALVSDKFRVADLLMKFETGFGFKRWAITTISQMAAHPYVYGLAEKLPLGLGKTEFDPEFEIEAIPLSLITLIPKTMSRLPNMNRHRSDIAAIYQSLIRPACLVRVPENNNPVYPRFPVLACPGPLPLGLRRLGVRRLYPKALHQEPPIARYAVLGGHCLHGVESLAQRLITLPTHLAVNGRTAEAIAHQTNQWIGRSSVR
jgi:dTDP-4-amino-4,6-dideoxygalactose transaminase